MFTTVLVPLDRSSFAEQAVGPAVAIAKASGGEIGFVLAHHVEPKDRLPDSSWRGATHSAEGAYIRAMVDEVARGSAVTVSGTVESGTAADVIRRRATEIGADLIVMTSHGRTGLSRAWIGSVADSVVRNASVPVLLIRPTESKGSHGDKLPLFERILVPLDGSVTSGTILSFAIALARCSNALLILARIVVPVPLYSYDGPSPSSSSAVVDADATRQLADIATADLCELAERLEGEGNTRVETEVVIAEHPAAALLKLAKTKAADMIAMTTRGRGASRLIVGSVTDKVLRGSRLPLLFYHPRATSVNRVTQYATQAEPLHLTPA